ncbi:DNA-processing protein DprA [Streptomyces sp. TRM 70361]|uniref:DNA-processing protein DprA n=1 Tax=Streptomyces sp. TRM 70361 TaxID=3116553 RepID=UPI002E7BC837|nr:DNA-processing protein DprA [Streptomyces sp. TRM 70361]MEE1941841.1 DNA-processing protein DprA [Streptomyces sp. TRM 70361]
MTGQEERTARAALTRVGEPGDEAMNRWIDRYGAVETLRALCSGPPLPGASPARWAGLRQRARGLAPEADLAAVAELGGRFVCPGDAEWPSQLDDLGDGRPVGLWVRGRASLRLWALRSVALVGARACTDYGSHVAAALGSSLAVRGWTVVSGAAYGVDAAAHNGSLAVEGTTVGVLACGVDVAYPPGNRALIRRIGEQGLLVAELPPGDHPTRSRFVLRNRVIAALTRGTVVVEAELRSGSLVTARRAISLGRVTMGVPGPVTSGLSAGVHQLLRGEGLVVTDAAEIIELVGSIGELAPERRGPILPRDLLTPEAARVLEGLPAGGGFDTAAAARAAALTEDRALARLRELRSLGFVEHDGGRWRPARYTNQHPNR